MSDASIQIAGVLLITVPTIAFGGATLLRAITARDPGYLDNQVRQNLWRAGHAHAGVLVVLALVGRAARPGRTLRWPGRRGPDRAGPAADPDAARVLPVGCLATGERAEPTDPSGSARWRSPVGYGCHPRGRPSHRLMVYRALAEVPLDC